MATDEGAICGELALPEGRDSGDIRIQKTDFPLLCSQTEGRWQSSVCLSPGVSEIRQGCFSLPSGFVILVDVSSESVPSVLAGRYQRYFENF